MSIATISPQRAKEILDQGASLVDIREADEHARERIPGARHVPLAGIGHVAFEPGGTIVFHCKSGARTLGNAARLKAAAPDCDVLVVDGGLDAWRRAGLPVVSDCRQPIELQRQVQIAAGSLAAIGALLALLASTWFAVLPLFVGAGLVFSGASGTCAMAGMLKRAPWNRRMFASVSQSSSP